jgi:aryl-alcohol dehydrogenase-like predicted oxidoreductase
MLYREFGRTGWQISEVGFGMWAMGEWTGESATRLYQSLERAVALGCNFFDTAYGYGWGKSEKLLGRLVRAHPDTKLFVATKLPPKNQRWPSRPHHALDDTFPPDHIIEFTEKSLENLGLDSIDLMQFHVWEDAWARDKRWQRTVSDLKRQGLVKAFGISVNRWEPNNGLEALRSGVLDAVQVVYNIFDQAPEDQLIPLCHELDIAVIARVPFDEGTLTGNITEYTVFAEDDWRITYFVPRLLEEAVSRANALRSILPVNMTMAEAALRFILANPDISTTIPGMRQLRHVEANMAVSDGSKLPNSLIQTLRRHRWDRDPDEYFDLNNTTPWASR